MVMSIPAPAQSELVDFLRSAFKRSDILDFARVFCASVYCEIQTNPPGELYSDFTAACARRGLIDESFFAALFLCVPSRQREISRLGNVFGITPDVLVRMKKIVPVLRPLRRMRLAVTAWIMGVGLGLVLNSITNTNHHAEPSRSAPLASYTEALIPFFQAELDECNTMYGEESQYCQQLAESMRYVDFSSCQGKRIRSRASRAPDVSKAENALDSYITRKQKEFHLIRQELSLCRETLAKATLASPCRTCPPVDDSSIPPLQPVEGRWTCRLRVAPYRCERVQWTRDFKPEPVVELLQSDDDHVLLPIPSYIRTKRATTP